MYDIEAMNANGVWFLVASAMNRSCAYQEFRRLLKLEQIGNTDLGTPLRMTWYPKAVAKKLGKLKNGSLTHR